MAPLVGRYFGKKGQKLDRFGANLAAAALLPGQGHRTTRNLIQSILQSMIYYDYDETRMYGIQSEKEAPNFLMDKVGEPHITSYFNHLSSHRDIRNAPHAVVPDIHATNFPAGRQTINDGGATMSTEAIFEIKTFTACNTRYDRNNATMSPAYRR